jgi:hypothetical protein
VTRKEAIAELEALTRDPNRQHIEEMLRQWPESYEISALLGRALLARKGYSRIRRRDDSLPVPPGLVHPG